jgi:hypothetical protein
VDCWVRPVRLSSAAVHDGCTGQQVRNHFAAATVSVSSLVMVFNEWDRADIRLPPQIGLSL